VGGGVNNGKIMDCLGIGRLPYRELGPSWNSSWFTGNGYQSQKNEGQSNLTGNLPDYFQKGI